jgi:hypothetical protein
LLILILAKSLPESAPQAPGRAVGPTTLPLSSICLASGSIGCTGGDRRRGFGGVTSDIARALGVDDGAWLPRRPDEPSDDPRWVDGREQPGNTNVSVHVAAPFASTDAALSTGNNIRSS